MIERPRCSLEFSLRSYFFHTLLHAIEKEILGKNSLMNIFDLYDIRQKVTLISNN